MHQTQEEKKEEMKRLKHNVKGTSTPAFYRGQKVVKSRPEKVQVVHFIRDMYPT